MQFFDSAILLVVALLASSLLNQFFPKISTPLIQVTLGVVIALGPISFNLRFEPELFMLFFIAPLLFNDGKLTDKKALWQLKAPILSLALGLVLATVLTIGYFVNWLVPSIPLAAAFALAAALAPTDAVAVSSMSEVVSLTNYEKHLLEGESLVNDASGVVAFQFAVAAMVTGAFSLISAGEKFLITFFGGIAVGLILAFLRYLLVRWLRSAGIVSTTFHVLLEIITPFVVYVVAEHLGVSGILAVVAAGIVQSMQNRRISPGAAKLNIVSTSVWSVLIFALNGLVFVLLGTQLPGTLRGIWQDGSIGNDQLVIYVLAICSALLLLRFVWAFIMPSKRDPDGNILRLRARIGQRKRELSRAQIEERGRGLTRDERRKIKQQARLEQKDARSRLKATMRRVPISSQLKEAALISLAGVKGSITLATVLTLPFLLADGSPFPSRNLIIFLASATIVASLLVANFVLPLISPKRHAPHLHETEVAAIVEILRTVLRELSWQMHSGNDVNRLATEEVLSAYSRRIANIRTTNELEDTSLEQLRLKTVYWQIEYVQDLLDKDEIGSLSAYIYLYRLTRYRDRITHKHNSLSLVKDFFRMISHRRLIKKSLRRSAAASLRAEGGIEKERIGLTDLPIQTYDYVLGRLDELLKDDGAPIEDVTALTREYTRRKYRAMQRRPDIAPEDQFETRIAEVEALGLQLEREAISDMLENDKISEETAKMLRDNVALMELDIEDAIE